MNIPSIFRAIVRNTGDDSRQLSNAQIEYFGKTGQTEVLYPYGLGGIAPVGSPALLMHINGSPENRVSIPYYPQGRLKNRKEGEVWLQNALTGSSIILEEDGILNVTSTGKATINIAGTATINCTGDVTVNSPKVTLAADVTLGSGGSAVARAGDPVISNIFPNPVIGSIASGSSRHTAD